MRRRSATGRLAALLLGGTALFGLVGCDSAATPSNGSAPPTPAVTPAPPTATDDIIELRRLLGRVQALYPSSPATVSDSIIELTAIEEAIANLTAKYADTLTIPRPVPADYGVRYNLYHACSNGTSAASATIFALRMLYPPPNIKRKPTPSDISESRQAALTALDRANSALNLAEKG
jgi:hypothetical protein